MKKLLTAVCFVIFAFSAFAHEEELAIRVDEATIYGSLMMPENAEKPPVVLFICGSGPTDRNGQSIAMGSPYILMAAEELAADGIASFRYDKRAIGKSQGFAIDNVIFEDFIADASSVVDRLKEDGRFSEIIICGHSEGGLIGAVVARDNPAVDKFIALATPGRPLDQILMEQLSNNDLPSDLLDEAEEILGLLKNGEKPDTASHALAGLFRPNVYDYWISQLRYDPAEVFGQITVPCIIIQGGTDIQVRTVDADRLREKNPKAVRYVIADMNHPLKQITDMNPVAQSDTYMNADIPNHPDLVPAIARFVRSSGKITGVPIFM